MSKVLKELKRRAERKTFSVEEYCFGKQIDFIRDPSKFKNAVCSRRCLAKGTLVQTEHGPKPIEDIKPGEYVYDEHGLPIEVVNVFDNGIQPVVEVLHNSRVMFKATKNHEMYTYNTYEDKTKLCKLEEFNSRTKIIRQEVDRNGGAHVKYAYAIGALLGDGCSREKGKNYVVISSENSDIPNQVAACLGANRLRKHPSNNFSYSIYANSFPEEYHMWCKDRYAHEKTCDVDRILSWDRESRLAFIAGLLDTDGSVNNVSDGIQISVSMQAKPVIDALQVLFLDLWQYSPSIYVDNRDKYKNGPVYTIRLKHNYYGNKILKDLDPYIKTPRKKWKTEYATKLSNNFCPKYAGVTFGKETTEHTYDIHVYSETNLYMLANGLITHNSGKTEACAADLLETALSYPHINVLYITLSRVSAKRIIWKLLQRLVRDYCPEAKLDNVELSISLPNGSMIYCVGAKDEGSIETFRGMAIKKVYIDECQSFRAYIKDLVDDVIVPALYDHDGSLILIGTPGPLNSGYFYDASHSDSWSRHHWTVKDNPWIKIKSGKEPEEILAQERKRRGVTESDPTYMRESLGLWAEDRQALVFEYNAAKNRFNELPAGKMEYIFGIDIGYNDADAIAVLGYSYDDNTCYLVEEKITTKQNISELVAQIDELKAKYEPVRMVMDAGALGKKIQDEIRRRHNIPMEAADKHRKFEFIKLLNDDLRTGRLKSFTGSRFEEDCNLVSWDRTNPLKLKMSTSYHSDINDAVLYAWRECKHYLYKEEEVRKVDKNTDEYMMAFWEKEAETLQKSNTDDFGGPSDQDIQDMIDDNWEY